MRKRFSLLLLVTTLFLLWTSPAFSDDEDAGGEQSGGFQAGSTQTDGVTGSMAGSAQTQGDAVATDDSQESEEKPESEEIYEMQASLGWSLEYNDNIEDRAHNKLSDFITHIKPYFRFTRVGGRIQADVDYRGDYLFYVKGKDTEEYRHYLKASATGELVENLFFLSVKEDMQQVYREVARGEVIDDDNKANDTVNRNRFTISPHFSLRPSERTNASFGYDFTDVRYSENDDENPKPASFNSDQYDFDYKKSQSHTVFLHLDHELSDRAVFYTGGSVTRWEDKNDENPVDQSFSRYIAYLGGAYEFSENMKLSLKAGPSFNSPDNHSSSVRPFVEAGLTYVVGRSEFGANYTTSYEDDAETGGVSRREEYKLQWTKDFDRSRLVASIGYNKYEDEVKDANYSRRDSGNRSRRNSDEGTTYRPSIRYTYDLTDRLSFFGAYSAQIYEDHKDGDHRHYGSYGLKYELSPDSTVGLSHYIRYNDSYEGDSFYTNRFMVEFTHHF